MLFFKRGNKRFASCLGVALVVVCVPTVHAQTCEALIRVRLTEARVTSAAVLDHLPGADASQVKPERLPRFCRVTVLATPSPDSRIHIEVWLPVAGWNGRLLSEGNGGFGGVIESGQLGRDLRLGFAAASTDMGTSPATPTGADALIGHPERWKDWGYRATHIMTLMAKRVIRAYYRTSPRFSYFKGCSTGGQQALSEVQRFPEDYNGVLGGAPANNRTRLHIAILWNYIALDQAVHAGSPGRSLPCCTTRSFAPASPAQMRLAIGQQSMYGAAGSTRLSFFAGAKASRAV